MTVQRFCKFLFLLFGCSLLLALSLPTVHCHSDDQDLPQGPVDHSAEEDYVQEETEETTQTGNVATEQFENDNYYFPQSEPVTASPGPNTCLEGQESGHHYY